MQATIGSFLCRLRLVLLHLGFRPRQHLKLARLQIPGEIAEVPPVAVPGPGEIGLPIGRSGRRRGEIHLAVRSARDSRDLVVHPLRVNGRRGKTNHRDRTQRD